MIKYRNGGFVGGGYVVRAASDTVINLAYYLKVDGSKTRRRTKLCWVDTIHAELLSLEDVTDALSGNL